MASVKELAPIYKNAFKIKLNTENQS